MLVPLVTPFTDDSSSLSEVRLTRLVQRLTKADIPGFVTSSDVGEFTTTSFSERKEIVEVVLRDAAGSCVVVNVSSLSTAASLDLAQHGKRHGARAAILMPPYYGEFTGVERVSHIQTVARHAGLPIILVDPQQRLGALDLEELSQTANLTRAQGLGQVGKSDWATWPRAATYEFALGTTLCSPLALVFPELAVGEVPPGVEAVRSLMAKGGVARVAKAALEQRGTETGPPRGPLRRLDPEGMARLGPALG